MARPAMVTRTITTTKVNVMCLNIQTGEPFNMDVVLAGTYPNPKALEKAVKKAVDDDTVKAVHVVLFEEIETLYGMKEEKFIQMADALPPRGTKAVATDDEQVA